MGERGPRQGPPPGGIVGGGRKELMGGRGPIAGRPPGGIVGGGRNELMGALEKGPLGGMVLGGPKAPRGMLGGMVGP